MAEYVARSQRSWPRPHLLLADQLHVACIIASFISLILVVLLTWSAGFVEQWFMNTSEIVNFSLGLLICLVLLPPILLANWLSMILLLPVSQRFRWLFLVPVVLGMYLMHRMVAEIVDESSIDVIAWFAPYVGLSMLLPSVVYALSLGRFQLGEQRSRIGLSDIFLLTLLTALALAAAQFTTEDMPAESLPQVFAVFAITSLGPCLLLGVALLLVSKRVCEGKPRAVVVYPISGLLILIAAGTLAIAAITSGYTDYSMLQDAEQQVAGLMVVGAILLGFAGSVLLTWRMLLSLQRLALRRPRPLAANAPSASSPS